MLIRRISAGFHTSQDGFPGCFHFSGHLTFLSNPLLYIPDALIAQVVPFPTVHGYKFQNVSFVRQTFYATTESPTETISWLQPQMFDFQGAATGWIFGMSAFRVAAPY